MEFQSYQVLEKAKVELLPILTLSFSDLFKKLKSHLRAKQGIWNKCKFSLKQAVIHCLLNGIGPSETIHQNLEEIYQQRRITIRDCKV